MAQRRTAGIVRLDAPLVQEDMTASPGVDSRARAVGAAIQRGLRQPVFMTAHVPHGDPGRPALQHSLSPWPDVQTDTGLG